MTDLQKRWRIHTEAYNTEKARLWKMSEKGSAIALMMIAKVEEMTGNKPSLRDAIHHLAMIKANKVVA